MKDAVLNPEFRKRPQSNALTSGDVFEINGERLVAEIPDVVPPLHFPVVISKNCSDVAVRSLTNEIAGDPEPRRRTQGEVGF
jgi:hypothetical protein